MQINTDVYPEVGYDSYKRWTNDVTYYTAGQPLEHSIFYAGSVSENMQFTDEQNYSYIATAPNCTFNIAPKNSIIKGDIFFAETGIRIHDLNSNWETNSGNNPKIVTSFDVSKFYFDLNNATCSVYDLSNPDGGHAIGSPETMTFDVYRGKTAEYKSTHFIRKISWNLFNGDSLCNYKEAADYSGIAVCPMIRYTFDDKSVIYAPPNLSEYGLPEWAGPINLDRLTDEGTFGAQNSDIYSLVYTYFGKWYNGFVSGGAAHRVSCSNPGESSVRVRAANDQGAQVNNGYHMPDPGTIDTDKYAIPVLLWGNQWNKRIEPFYTDEYVMRYFASFGVRFKVGEIMYIGYMDSNGWCNGDYILESELPDSDSANKNITDFTGSSYDSDVPYVPPVPPGGDKIDDMNVNPLWAMSSDAGFARYFLMSNDQIGSLKTWLSDTTFPEGYDPYPYIISLLQFPLKLSPDYCMPRTPSGHIVIGGEDTGITASLIANEKAWKGLGTYDVPRENGNFLDYSPYSQYEVYIPCCGWVTCPDIIAGRKIAVKVNYDLTTAAIIGNVYVTIDGNEMIVASKSGMMGRETIVSGDAAGVRSAQITSALLSAGTGALNVATGAMSGNAVAAVSGGYHVVAGLAQANIAANSSYARTVGSTGGRALLCQYDKCYLKICTTETDIPAGYGHTVGYICNKSGKVSDFRGYTVFDNFDVTGITGLTQRELMEVKRIMESGVYINSPPE